MSGQEEESQQQAMRDTLFRRMNKRHDEMTQQRSAMQNRRQETADKYNCLTAQLLEWASGVQEKVRVASERQLDPEADFMEATAVLDALAKEMQDFDAYFKDNSHSLSRYDTERTQVAANEMRSDYLRLQDELQPKKKFGFRSKAAKSETRKKDASKAAAVPAPAASTTFTSAAVGYRVTNPDRKSIVDVPEGEVRDLDVSLDGLRDCVVRMLGTPSTVHATNLENVTIICGPVRTSFYLESCVHCTFVVACQQLRTHATTDSTFYLHVTSRAIIEDCSNVGFAPYNLDYPSLKEHFAEAGLDENRNAWSEIDDFNWLSRGKASPNWHLVPEGKRQTDWSNHLLDGA